MYRRTARTKDRTTEKKFWIRFEKKCTWKESGRGLSFVIRVWYRDVRASRTAANDRRCGKSYYVCASYELNNNKQRSTFPPQTTIIIIIIIIIITDWWEWRTGRSRRCGTGQQLTAARRLRNVQAKGGKNYYCLIDGGKRAASSCFQKLK